MHNEVLAENTLCDREEARKAVLDLIHPYMKLIGADKISTGHGATFSPRTIELELVSRLLWGVVPGSKFASEEAPTNSSVNKIRETAHILRQAIIDGTTPESKLYWGVPGDFDQQLVEMPAIAFAILSNPDEFWHPLNPGQQDNLLSWLSWINKRKLPPCNWQLFPLVVNAAFSKISPEHMKPDLMEKTIQEIDSYYLSQGWYNDGPVGTRRNRDYYVPWAYHFFALIFTKFMPDFDTSFTSKVRQRAIEFTGDYRRWFHQSGSALPFGRSLAYRFAQSAFWAACAWSDLEVLPWAEVRRIWTANLRWWLSKPMYTDGGLLSVGYTYPNLFMSERYNSPASPLWALQAFLHIEGAESFWQEHERGLPQEDFEESLSYSQEESGMILCSTGKNGHVYAVNSGQWTSGDSNAHNHMAEKYEKFTYSTHFGFHISLDQYGTGKIAPDNTLLIGLDGKYYRHKHNSTKHYVTDSYVCSNWNPFQGVKIQTRLYPLGSWHIRVHRVTCECRIFTLEGGFPLPHNIDGNFHIPSNENLSDDIGESSFGVSGILDMSHSRRKTWVNMEVNSNILYPHAWLPVLSGQIEAGKHILITAVLADPDNKKGKLLWKQRDILSTFLQGLNHEA